VIEFRRTGTMRADDVLEWVNAVPFVPFRIRPNSGRTFDVRHPEMIRVGRTTAYIFSYFNNPPNLLEKTEMIGLILIEAIEPLEPARSEPS
jgi:hypothetical protein